MAWKFPYLRRVVLSLAVFLLVALRSFCAESDVTGRVTDRSGAPVPGATVFVYTAGPKVGTSPFCPSCYPDCGKSAQSDTVGNFTLPGLSAQLVFRLLVVAKGFTPKFIPKVEQGQTVAAELTPRKSADAPEAQTVRGRVAAADGAPIRGAVLEIDGADFGQRQQYGGLHDTDPLAVTDENGEFLLTTGMPALALSGRLSARNFANQSIHLATGKTHALTMTEGATLTGRVVQNGKPLPNVVIGVSPQDRRAGSFVGNFEIGTDADGKFTLPNLPPKTDYTVFGKMETIGQYGTIAGRAVHVGRDGATTDIGDIAVQGGRRLSGRVVLEDGAKLPEKTRLLIGRDQVSDTLSIELGPDGEFAAQGVPAGVVNLMVRVPGYRISPKNPSYEPANRRVTGRLESDLADFQLLLEKGAPPSGPISAASLPRFKPGEHPRERPLRGMESSR